MSEPSPRGPTPPLYDGDLREQTSPRTLVEDLGDVVDDIRQIASDLGARPHTYHSITVRWSGGDIGRGEAEVIRDVAIVPTPRTEPVGYLDRSLLEAGVIERGDVVLTGVSPRLTEDEIDTLCGNVVDAPGYETFVEQRMDVRDGSTRRRRFVAAKAPERRTSDWRIVLRRADGDRARDGEPRAERHRVWRKP